MRQELIEKLQDELKKDIFSEDDEDIDFQEDMNSYLDSLDDEYFDYIDDVIEWYLFY